MHPMFTSQTHGTEPYMLIGKVSEITGASNKAIRHYESIGLLPAPQRKGKYRVYSEQDVFLVHLIKYAQGAGFSLSELRDLVQEKVEQKRFPLKLAAIIFRSKRESLRAEIESLLETQKRLDEMEREMYRIFGSEHNS